MIQAINEQNTTNPSGRIGREPAPPGTQFTMPVTANGRLSTPEEFANIILRARPDGSVLHIRDVGTVTLGSQSYDNVIRLNGKPTGGLIVYLRAGANALQAKTGVVARMDELAKHFPPGVHWAIGFDLTPFITASIHEVELTLFLAIILVTIVVYVFLQNWRSTLIPALAVPVSIIGTFFGMAVLGFTVNLLTLFGLVLSIGIVVDDAIIVIENVERIMEDEHVSAPVAADRAIRQLRSALIAIVIVLCSVFIPVAFIGGITGALYKQFAVTIVIAVILSGVVALSLTPALCSVLLTGGKQVRTRGFFGWFNRRFDIARNKYVETMHKVSPYSAAAVGVLLVAVGHHRLPVQDDALGVPPQRRQGLLHLRRRAAGVVVDPANDANAGQVRAVPPPPARHRPRLRPVRVQPHSRGQPDQLRDHLFGAATMGQAAEALGAGGRAAADGQRLLLHPDPRGVCLFL